MRGVICYYSGSGNTSLACRYLAEHAAIDFDLVDIIADQAVDLADYDVVGLAASTDFGGMPRRFEMFLEGLPRQDDTLAFALNTYGLASGRTLVDLVEAATNRGFSVVAAHSLRMPENYPPMIALGLGFPRQPSDSVARRYDAFIAGLNGTLGLLAARRQGQMAPVRAGVLARLSPRRDRRTARRDMGEKFVDAALCTQCGACAKGCPYGAITMAPLPSFDMNVCYGCWRCYNHCPQHAIYTAKFRGGPYYPCPAQHARQRLGR